MRIYMVMVFALGCGKHAKQEGGGSGSGSAGSATPVATTPADAAQLDAAAAAPAVVLCSGHWSAKLASEPDSAKCSKDQIAPYSDVDLTIAGATNGWQITVTKPAGFEVTKKDFYWTASDCAVEMTLRKDKMELSYRVARKGNALEMSGLASIPGDHKACYGGASSTTPTFTPDNAPLPPIEATRATYAGTYDLTFTWPAVKCTTPPATHKKFSIALDRADGDQAVATQIDGWNIIEVHYYDDRKLDVRSSTQSEDDHAVAERLRLQVNGDQVTGEVSMDMESNGADDDISQLCKPATGKVTGTIKR